MVLRKGVLRTGAVALSLAVMATMLLARQRASAPSTPVVVSGVSQWGALARATFGPSARVITLLSDPNADPHNHEATVADAARVAEASLVIENGAGYDAWLSRLVSARPTPPRVLNVADLMGVHAGENPHLFYDLSAARRVVTTLAREESGDALVAARASATLAKLATLQDRVRALDASCAGVPVAATEDVTGYLLRAMGLTVVTPAALRVAVGNGVDPSVSDLAEALGQLRQHPALLIDNVQTATPLTDQMVATARANQVPVIEVTETMSGTNYVTWIGRTISEIRAALVREGCA